ncbi:2-desacetyl-2-hydroxyethyl bacteriochlorophyllide A dehydrogenase [Nakamurella sp. UYEF19]|uniref:L-idonate 5-dehydrogenase n=1 Tax=Nakamurella sp. UYEF19 TaxID=1756392 RepID=UPI0033914B7F
MNHTYRALVIHAAGDLRIDQRELPVPEPNQAVVAITHGGICGSDLHYLSHGAAGQSILREPMVLGHEVVGRVRSAAADGSGPAVGTPVAIFPATPCGHCRECLAGNGNVCATTTYLGSAARTPHTDGAFADLYTVTSDRLLPLPAGLDLRIASLIEPASVAWHAVSQAGSVHGKRVLVVGAGPIGSLVVAVLKRAGAAEIIVTDVFERPLRVAAELGATSTYLAKDFHPEDVDADIAIDSSGSAIGVASAVRGLGRRGHLVLLGLLPAGEQPFLVSQVITRELTVAGSFRFHGEMPAVIGALADGSLQVDPVVSHAYPVADAHEAFAMARDSAASGKVLLTFGASVSA